MTAAISENTQAILLLTAPLASARGKVAPVLSQAEYTQLVELLRGLQRQPKDLLARDDALVAACGAIIDERRLARLLARGFQLSQAVDHWHTRAIWVMSRADPDYPRRLKVVMGQGAPPVLYGVGVRAALDAGGLAVVGSRAASADAFAYALNVGRRAAEAERTIIAGPTRGVDHAPMFGALEAGGRALGVMADCLEAAALNRANRPALMDGRLVLVSPLDPSVRFDAAHASQRHQIIDALADAMLVVNCAPDGETWAAAVAQLERRRIYVRPVDEPVLTALKGKGALPWPEPLDRAGFDAALSP